MQEEGILDRAAREKREREAKEQSVLNGLKIQRAALAVAFLAAAGVAGYCYVQSETATSRARAESDTARKEIADAKSSVEKADKTVADAKAKLDAAESARREERVASDTKVAALEAQMATLRDEKVALQAKVDALQANTAPQVMVVNNAPEVPAGSGTSKSVKPAIQFAVDKDAIATLIPWAKSMSTYSKTEGPAAAVCSTYKRFREWASSHLQLLRDRADAKGWSADPKVHATLVRLGQPVADVNGPLVTIDEYRRSRDQSDRARTNKSMSVRRLSGFIEDGYADIQVVGYIMTDATTVGPVKKCNE